MYDLRQYVYEKQFKEGDRIFPFSAASLNYSIKKYSKIAGVPKIRIHDLRHSHTSLLVSQGFNAAEIADRLGHEKVETTLNIYTHLYAQQRQEISDSLETIISSLNI